MKKQCGSSRAVAALMAAFATGALAVAAAPDAGGPDAPDSRYAVAPKTVPPVQGGSPEYQAENPANNLRFAFSRTGVIASPGLTGTTAWSLDLRAVGVSFDGRFVPTNSPTNSASGNRVDYDYGTLRVAYINTPSGLEQRSSIVAPADRGKPGASNVVVLELSVDGGLKPVKAGYYIDLVSAAGELELRFGPVDAKSADGIPLDAHLEVAADDKENPTGARVVIDATNAEYPIEVSAAVISPAVGKSAAPISPPGAATGEIVGVPVTISSGISETVGQIMERDKLTPPYLLGVPREPHNETDVELEITPNPNAPPPLSHWPPIPQTSSGVIVGPPNLPQTVGTSFKGVGYSESFFIPPDSVGDVGPTQILIHTNGRIKVFDKSGGVGFLNASYDTFWASQGPRTYTGDSQVRYDRLSGRWFVLTIDFLTPNNKVLLAVSSGSSISLSSYFTFYSFTVDSVLPADASNWCDYPSLGVDANALYIGCNMYNPAGVFQYASAIVIRKSSLTGGGPIVATGFSGIATVGSGPFAPRGVDNDDPSWTEGYFMGTEVGSLSALSIRRISDPGGTPTLGPSRTLLVSNTPVLAQPALGSTQDIDAVGLRLFAASIHKNKITGVTSLWTAHSVETDTACTPASGSGVRIGAKWYEIGSLTTTPAITQFGTLCSTAAGSGIPNTERGFLFPTVVETGQGHMALAASYASQSEFVGVAAAGRLRTDPPAGTRAPETIVLAGLASYTINDSVPRNRWGDYSFTDVDPNDDQTVWTFQEYADTPSNNWAVRAVQLKAPPPPTTATAGSPVCNGYPAVPVNINGGDTCAAPTCTNGLCTGGGACPEFFDPGPDTGGPGYANHLTATATGGVTVNSANIIIPANPATQRVRGVALSLNTTATTIGAKTVSIVNPDGQGRAYNNVITVIANRLPVANTGGPYSSCQGGSVVLSGTGSTDPDAVCGDSLVSYEWDLNNDATFDVTGATPTVTAAQLAAFGLGLGPHTIKLRVTDTHSATNTGSGTLTILSDGSACTDVNACTQTDACQAGVCVGSNPVTCGAVDQCHVAGVCEPGTGVCSNPNEPDGTVCSDVNACTQTDACQAGVCVGSNAVTCSAVDQCHVAGVCDPGTGVCSNPNEPDGTVCSDGDACTSNDVCTDGGCAGTPFSGPLEVGDGVQVSRAGTDANVTWSLATGATTSSVVRGRLDSFPVGSVPANETCLASRVPAPTAIATDPDVPATGTGFWYLVRGENACGVGPYGYQGQNGVPTVPEVSLACP